VAVRFEQNELSFAAVDSLSTVIALRLSRKLSASSIVGILASNGLVSLPLHFACAKARLARVPLNARLSAAEHQAMLSRAEIRLLVFSADQLVRARTLAGALPDLELLLLDQLAAGADAAEGDLAERSPDDPCWPCSLRGSRAD